MMDVSFSAWRNSREESLQLKGDSFSFLFDRRYTNRLNRMSRVFFEAYVVATKELAAQEDRFPSLSEIDAKMESGAVYAFKDRLVKNTEFFEEVKISGVSYLVPRASRFVDASGTYTDLILTFEDGAVVLPTRRKTPLPLQPEQSFPEEKDEPNATKPEHLPPGRNPGQVEPTEQSEPETKPEPYPLHSPEPFEEVNEPPLAAVDVTTKQNFVVSNADVMTSSSQEAHEPLPIKKKIGLESLTIVLVGAIILMAAAVVFFWNTGSPSIVLYSAYLSNSSNESYLGLDIKNPTGMPNELEMNLPQDIDRSISARGGIVTISHANNTLVRMNTSSDASIKIYLLRNWTTVPVSLNLSTPANFDTSLEVHGRDYLFTHKNDTLMLNFNLTEEGVSFEQSYNPKR